MTRIEDIARAIALGVDAVGVILYSKSPRGLGISEASSLLQRIPAFIDVVAVLVNPDVHFVKQVVNELPIQYIQFHGDETPEFCEQFDKPYIKAVPATSLEGITKKATEYQGAAALLLDTPSTTHRGGTGATFDWELIPKRLDVPIILAGGLNSDNVQSAMMACLPYAVDVCSGIEASIGIKNHDKMSRFVQAVWEKK